MRLIKKNILNIFLAFVFFVFPTNAFATELIFNNSIFYDNQGTSSLAYQDFPFSSHPTCSTIPPFQITDVDLFAKHVSGDNNYRFEYQVWNGSSMVTVASTSPFSLPTTNNPSLKEIITGFWDLKALCYGTFSSSGSPFITSRLRLVAVSSGLSVVPVSSDALSGSRAGSTGGAYDGVRDLQIAFYGFLSSSYASGQPYVYFSLPLNQSSYSLPVTFTTHYFAGDDGSGNPIYDTVYTDLVKVSPWVIYDIVPFEVEDPFSSFTYARTLDDNETYRVRAYLSDSSGLNPTIFSEWVTFYTGSAQPGDDYQLTPPLNASTTPSDVANVSSFFASIPPFSWISGFSSFFSSFSSSATTSTSTLSLPYSASLYNTIDSGTVDLDLVAISTLPPVVIMRSIISMLLYLMVGLFTIFFIFKLISR